MFGKLLRGKCLRIYSDNSGAEAALSKAASRVFDQNAIVHVLWKKMAVLGLEAWIGRVPTKDNIADLPSRCSGKVRCICCCFAFHLQGEL